jgi:hypothetical protein
VPWTLRHSGKPLFSECISSPSAQYLTLGEARSTRGISILP